VGEHRRRNGQHSERGHGCAEDSWGTHHVVPDVLT
jgi:hypothetical protein